MRALLAPILLAAALSGCATLGVRSGGSGAPTAFTATLSPPAGVTSSGTGAATLSLNTKDKVLTYRVEYSGLTGAATAAHIHGPAEPGANAPPVIPLPTTASPIMGVATLSDAQIADLRAGRYYVNVHTVANRGGEIRGQILAGR